MDFMGYQKNGLRIFLAIGFVCNIDLSDPVLEKFLRHFKTKFDYINGYTSSIVLFAKFFTAKNIVLKTFARH
jgi:phenylacetate-CoA ligase